jgi:hypothetical protein
MGCVAAATLGLMVAGGAGTAAADPVAPRDLRPGDCLDGYAGNGAVYGVNVVPCELPHDAEILKKFSTTGAWPGIRALNIQSQQLCADAPNLVRSVVFHYQYSVLWPDTAAAWATGPYVYCLAKTPGAESIGSATQALPLVPTGSFGG